MIKLNEKELKEKEKYFYSYMDSGNNASKSEVDPNSNVTSKSVATFGAENNKDINKQINIYILGNRIEKLFGKEAKENFYKDMSNDIIYLHDASSSSAGVPYCVAIDLHPFIMHGDIPLGGNSKAPKHLASFCGAYVNLIFLIAGQFAGACLYKDQKIIIKEKDVMKSITIKDFTDRYIKTRSFEYDNSIYEVGTVDENVEVYEQGKFVKIRNVFRRKYNKEIYHITTKSGKEVYCSENHKFEVLYRGRNITVEAKDLSIEDTLYNTFNDFSNVVDKGSYSYKEGQLYGILAGNGRVNNKQVELSIRLEEDYFKDFMDSFGKEYFENLYKGSIKKDKGSYILYLGSTKVYNKLQEHLIGDKFYNKHINVEKENLDFQLGFLDGLIATDGGYNNSMYLSLSNELLIKNVQDICANIGIHLKYHSIEVEGNRQPAWSIYLPMKILSVLELSHYRESKNTKFTNALKRDRSYIGKLSSNNILRGSKSLNRYKDNLNTDYIVSIEKINNDDEYVYEIETETHWYSAGMIKTHNCADVSLLTYFDYFARKDYGDDYLNTHTKIIENHLQQLIYTINAPSGGRGQQSVFYNTSIFDKNYFDSLLGGMVMPDFTHPKWESVEKLQKFFMKWFNKERTKALLTFPVITVAFQTKDGKPKDEQFEDFIAEEMSEGNSFFLYSSDSVDSLSSCCFSKDQKVLARVKDKIYYANFGDLGKTLDDPDRTLFNIFHNGSWCNGKLINLPNRQMYEITTSNNKKIVVSDNHLNPTLRGDISTLDLTTEDYLLFNTRVLDYVPEQNQQLTYEQGYAVGAFLGDGSLGSSFKDVIYEVTYSLNKSKLNRSIDKLNTALQHCGSSTTVKYKLTDKELVTVRVSSKELAEFIIKWTNWERGTYSFNKKLNLGVLLQSKEFRQGILDGLYDTDGGNSNRIYTTSTELVEHIEILATSLGLQSVINISDRSGEVAFTDDNGKEYIRNYPLYCIRWYNPLNKRSMKDVFVVKNNSVYFKIKDIKKIDYTDSIYCFEMENSSEPYFTLPNGIITHNCRLKNEIERDENNFTYTLGGTGLATGSKKVITINFNRLIQKNYNLEELVKRIHKYLVAFDDILYEEKEKGMLPVYDGGYISLDKQYLTIGVNGMVEGAEYLGLEISDNEEYKEWIKGNLSLIKKLNKEEAQIYSEKFNRKTRFNTEFVPAESLGVRFAKKDKAEGLKVNRDCYNSYFYKVEDESLDIFEKFNLYAKDIIDWLDGGSAYHMNISEIPTKETWKKIIEYSTKIGCNYWTYNCLATCCEESDCGYINKNTTKSCVMCGSKNISYATRVIGYLKKISHFSEDRQKEAGLRIYKNPN